jgi:SAM-dependent methyltransferase
MTHSRPPSPRLGAFSADWLQQREPFDAIARTAAALRLTLPALAALRPDPTTPWRVIDLACGTGANLRWLAPRLGGAQQWLVVDRDVELLQRWPACLKAAAGPAHGTTVTRAQSAVPLDEPLSFGGPGFAAAIVRHPLDLASRLEALPWQAAHLVTASALLDLVSAAWLQRVVAAAVSARVALLFALSVYGRHRWIPRDRHDTTVGALFEAHQGRDKGFGPALGAHGAPELRRALAAAGWRVRTARSDWWLDGRADPHARALQQAMVDGIAIAACEQEPAATATVRAWQARRHAWAATGSLRVGHIDLLALPPD